MLGKETLDVFILHYADSADMVFFRSAMLNVFLIDLTVKLSDYIFFLSFTTVCTP